MSSNDSFRQQQQAKRGDFQEQAHAAFILSTTLTRFGVLTLEQKLWVYNTYPHSIIETGNDQGLQYYSIEPRFFR